MHISVTNYFIVIGYDDHTEPEHSNAVSQPTKQIKEISLKDITDIALTTLAFLSFGMFILQVLMCITMVIYIQIRII